MILYEMLRYGAMNRETLGTPFDTITIKLGQTTHY